MKIKENTWLNLRKAGFQAQLQQIFRYIDFSYLNYFISGREVDTCKCLLHKVDKARSNCFQYEDVQIQRNTYGPICICWSMENFYNIRESQYLCLTFLHVNVDHATQRYQIASYTRNLSLMLKTNVNVLYSNMIAIISLLYIASYCTCYHLTFRNMAWLSERCIISST